MTRLRAIVSGKVQGVNFRNSTTQKAIQLGLNGYVRNLSDGTVEAVAEGEQEALESLLEFLRKGPAMAEVESVETEWGEAEGSFNGFTIRY